MSTTAPIDIPAEIERRLPALIASSKKIAVLKKRIEAQCRSRKLAYQHARDASSRCAIEIGAINRTIRFEEALLRRRLAREISADLKKGRLVLNPTTNNENPETS